MPALRILALTAALAVSVTGCARMDASLDQTWVDVTFKPNTSVPTIQHVRRSCARVPNVRAEPLRRPYTVINLMSGVRFDTTRATDANVAELQICLQKFSSVQGFTPGDTGDEGG